MDTNKKCAHPSCHCQAKKDSDYCSTWCEGEAKTADILCSCGHPACAEHAAAGRPGVTGNLRSTRP